MDVNSINHSIIQSFNHSIINELINTTKQLKYNQWKIDSLIHVQFDQSLNDSFTHPFIFNSLLFIFNSIIHSFPFSYRQLVPIALLCVQSKAFPRLRSPRSSRPLLRRSLRNRRHQQRFHPRFGVKKLLFAEPRVHHIHDSIDRHRRLRYIRTRHYLPHPSGSRLKRGLLLRWGQRREKRDDTKGSFFDGPRGHRST